MAASGEHLEAAVGQPATCQFKVLKVGKEVCRVGEGAEVLRAEEGPGEGEAEEGNGRGEGEVGKVGVRAV